jgi:hypothetical protein
VGPNNERGSESCREKKKARIDKIKGIRKKKEREEAREQQGAS